ncbi:hypothetical protein AGDE_04340 [Angomonas deanei]|nr:hypothetical protein AGDE_04340 [Angomonas deanei]|eukprot:EPY39588.1 hypothetical protein AGDE_04340 [Angomonas deanei]
MKLGSMYVDYKVQSRDHKRSIRVEEALVDPQLPTTIMPYSWLEALRSSSTRLPTGYYKEEPVYVAPRYGDKVSYGPKDPTPNVNSFFKPHRRVGEMADAKSNAIQAGPVVMYITGQVTPVVLNPIFVPEDVFQFSTTTGRPASKEGEEESCEVMDIRIGLDAIEQCSLYSELRPGGLLYSKLPHRSVEEAMAPVQDVLKGYGMKVGLAESPLVPRPWTRMKHMFIDELQRGPKLTEFVGHNPRNGTAWRFSQHNRYFRAGIWRETIRRNEMNEGLHTHSSWQKSPQQSVPGVNFLAPYP